MGKILGIDLGTTNSAMAIVEGGQPKILENSEGMRTTPSIVAISESGILKISIPKRAEQIVKNIKEEIMKELEYVKGWNCKFVTLIPKLEIV